MKADLFWRGLAIGFSIAAPVGPIGVLCIRRVVSDGRLAGLVSGLGAATADAFYGTVAGFGLTAISRLFVSHQIALRLLGGLFLCGLGIKTFIARPASRSVAVRRAGLAAAYASTFFLTLTNPLTILSFAAVFAGLGLGQAENVPLAATWLVLGVFSGSAFWWLSLSTGVALFRERFDDRGLRWLNRLSGLVITAFGLIALGSLRH